jgi:hypothetical protein
MWSKNRPFQLKEFLRTFRKYVKCSSFDLQIIYKYDAPFESRLQSIINANRDVTFIAENNFWNQTFTGVMHAKNNNIMFATDDLIFFREIDLYKIERVFNSHPHGRNFFAFNTRWHPELKYCQSAGMVLQQKPTQFMTDDDFFYFDHSTGSYDWHYPFEVSGSIYRKNEVIQILQSTNRKYGSLGNPNAFESFTAQNVVNKETSETKNISNWCFCPISASAACIPANRVSNSSGCPTFDCGYSLEAMNDLFDQNRMLDDSWYAANTQESAHIPKFVLK